MTAALAAMLLLGLGANANAYNVVSADSLRAWLNTTHPPFLLDVREQSEYDAGHIAGAALFPWNSGVLRQRYAELPADTTFVVICLAGSRSALASAFLDSIGGRFSGKINWLDGGMNAWNLLPVPLEEELTSPGNALPAGLALEQNRPNPFNPSTSISFSLPGEFAGEVTLTILDLRGRLVRTLFRGQRAGGRFTVLWDGADRQGRPMASGSYFCRLEAGRTTIVRKLVLLK